MIMPDKITPKKGQRFYHKTWLSPRDNSPQLFEITRVATGVVYYRPVYFYQDQNVEKLGGSMYETTENFAKRVLKWDNGHV